MPLQLNSAAWRIVDLHGMAVVEDLVTSRLIAKVDGFEIALDKSGQINGGLVFTTGAGAVFSTQRTPIFRSFGAGIAPMGSRVLVLGLGCTTGDDQDRCKNRNTLSHTYSNVLVAEVTVNKPWILGFQRPKSTNKTGAQGVIGSEKTFGCSTPMLKNLYRYFCHQ